MRSHRTLGDVNRLCETGPPIVVCRNGLATGLARPQACMEQNAEINQYEKRV